ncbi:beta-ketoacyl synthase chain length factor [Neisseria sp. 74A18]|uniref:beta-ketoacyl synthase chain length factor n=1 Tax=Neisseria sp. 74A18 TaxID=1696094 RepID=UPI0006CAF107|nr:beta-ketoacyl synthase chain length factor [Neisseria sp. 74A18]KPN74928.1 3-oxoacyl-ACP synthase [Neisseria sp. 74A18]
MNPLSHCHFSFDIADWQASSGKLAGLEAWQQWAADARFADTQPDYKPELAFLPAMQRRRLGKAARLVCDAAWNLAEQYPESALVFASHDGELNRSFELWLELMKTHTVSPTSFGLSVHNAQVGQWSMLRKDMRENTALAVGSDGLETALAEAYALMQEGAQQVLLIVADDPLSEEYALEAERAPMPYALAMLLKPGRQYSLSLSYGEKSDENPSYWGALDWIRFMLSNRHEETRCYGKRCWLWQKTL